MKDMKGHLEAMRITGRTPLFVGPPGIAKSAVTRQFADEYYDGHISVVPMASTSPMDARGRVIETADGHVKTQPPDNLLALCEKPGVLFLDEFDKATVTMQGLFLPIVQEREVCGKKFHKDTMIVLAANPIGEGGAWDIIAPLVNRVTVIPVEAHLETTLDYLDTLDLTAGRAVIGFLKSKPELLYKKPELEGQSFPTPRAWEGVARIVEAEALHAIKNVATLVCGTVGEGAGLEFMTYKNQFNLPTIEDILSGKWKPDAERLDITFAAGGLLVNHASKIKGNDKMGPVWDAVERIFETTGASDIGGIITRNLAQKAKKIPPPHMLEHVGNLIQ